VVRRGGRARRRLPARGARGRAPGDLLPARARRSLVDEGTALGGGSGARAARDRALARSVRGVRRRTARQMRRARAPPRRAPHPRRLLLGRSPRGVGARGRPLALRRARARSERAPGYAAAARRSSRRSERRGAHCGVGRRLGVPLPRTRGERKHVADYERVETVEASADDLFAYLSDVGNLPDYMRRMTSAEPAGDGARAHDRRARLRRGRDTHRGRRGVVPGRGRRAAHALGGGGRASRATAASSR
jgi:hypothetical protein